MSKFDGKIIIVTGAAGGIGKEVVRKLSSEGAKITLVDLKLEAVQQVIEEFNLGDQALAIQADVSKEMDVKNFVDKTIEKFGRVDGLVNNAGVEGPTKPIEEVTEEDYEFVYGINVKGPFFGMKYVLPLMKAQKSGSIVNTASIVGFLGTENMILYSSSKHALMGMNKSAALEGAPYNVRVNTVNPGVANTAFMRRVEETVAPGNAEAARAAYNEGIPLNRYAEPHEVANVIAFLLSDEASYVTSSAYTVHGGMYNV